jgi:hypothetical protein
MRIELGDLDQKTFNRACAQLDAEGILYTAYYAPALKLCCVSDDPTEIRCFINVALHDPDARVYRG